mgnify:CR=1 FL=1
MTTQEQADIFKQEYGDKAVYVADLIYDELVYLSGRDNSYHVDNRISFWNEVKELLK